MYLVDVLERLESGSSKKGVLSETTDVCSSIYENMDVADTLWVFTPHILSEEFGPITPMSLCDSIQADTDLLLRNLITVYRHIGYDSLLRGSFEEILLLVKDKENYYFDKDSIRVEPVYQGNEWNGNRENGRSSYRDKVTKRYNSEGKDPGNVWMEEIRTETSNKVLDRTIPISRKEAIKRCVRAGSKRGDVITVIWPSDEAEDIIESEDRIANLKQNMNDDD